MRNLLPLILVFILTLTLNGCTVIFQKGRRVDVDQISRLKNELNELERAKMELEDRLKNEIKNDEIKVEMLDKGLVITFVAEVLFDSGKADLRQSSFDKLDKLSSVINTTVRNLNIGIEGHTDNVPIKYSGWKSNWELSSARALSVLHYFVDNSQVNPKRLSAIGYGEYHPIAPNATKNGRQMNRRVEVIIIPEIEKTGR
jgi:chemotaxis protein MotB